MRRDSLDEARARVCSRLSGDVVEIGFGTGLNVGHYPESVSSVAAIEPSALCWKLAQGRISRRPIPIRNAGLRGEHLELPDGSFAAILSTWTLCSIPDLASALSEFARVLAPGGALHFVEHGHSPDAGVLRWQRRLEPLQKRVAGGCHLTREIPQLVEAAGFKIDRLDTYYQRGEPKAFGWTFEGVASLA